jgi:hypothetical protein
MATIRESFGNKKTEEVKLTTRIGFAKPNPTSARGRRSLKASKRVIRIARRFKEDLSSHFVL